MTLDNILDEIIETEGGYVNHPADRGGPTKYGITLSTLKTWRKAEVTEEDVKDLTVEEALGIYRHSYFTSPGFDVLPPALWPFVVDAAVHHGPGGAIKLLQLALGVKDDGVLGPKTLAAVGMEIPKMLAARFVAQRAMKFGRIVTRDPSQAVFASGWLNRLAKQIENLS